MYINFAFNFIKLTFRKNIEQQRKLGIMEESILYQTSFKFLRHLSIMKILSYIWYANLKDNKNEVSKQKLAISNLLKKN